MSESVADTEQGTRRDSVTSYGTGVPENEHTRDSAKNDSPNDQKSTPWYRRKRFWIIFIIGQILITVIMVPIILLVVFPAIVKSMVNKSNLTFDSLNIHFPMNETHFGLNTTGSISNGGPFGATLSFPEGAQLVYNDTVICELTVPDIKISGGNGNVSSSTVAHIVNGDAFINFVQAQMNNENVTFTFKSSVKVKAFGISNGGINLNKDITINGTNGFKDTGAVSVTSFAVDPKAFTTTVTVNLMNRSPTTVILGTLGVHNIYKNVTLGPSTAQNLTLIPGSNIITLNGTITPKSLNEQPVMLELFTKYATGVPINVTTVGDFAKPDGVNQISWLDAGVKAISFITTLQSNSSNSTSSFL